MCQTAAQLIGKRLAELKAEGKTGWEKVPIAEGQEECDNKEGGMELEDEQVIMEQQEEDVDPIDKAAFDFMASIFANDQC